MPRRAAQKLSSTWRSSSLRTQLVTITTALLLLTLVVTTFVSASLFRQELLRNMDEDLTANAELVSGYLHQQVDPGQPEVDHGSIVRFHGWIVDTEGDPVLRTHWPSENQDHPALPRPTIDEAEDLMGESFDVPGTLENSRGWRVQVHPLSSGEGSLVIALPLRSVETSVERATFLVATIGLLATLGASIIAYSLVTRAFRPLLRVERTAGAIAAGDFSQRVQTTAPRETEVGRLAASLNVMLEHIEQAFDARVASEEKMRRFIQDASHELRTPLVTIRGFSELYRQGGMEGNDEAVHAAMGRIESEATRLGDLVEDLLTLARLDEQRPMKPMPLDLNIVAHEAMMDMSVNAPDREVRVIGLDDGPARLTPSSAMRGAFDRSLPTWCRTPCATHLLTTDRIGGRHRESDRGTARIRHPGSRSR